MVGWGVAISLYLGRANRAAATEGSITKHESSIIKVNVDGIGRPPILGVSEKGACGSAWGASLADPYTQASCNCIWHVDYGYWVSTWNAERSPQIPGNDLCGCPGLCFLLRDFSNPVLISPRFASRLYYRSPSEGCDGFYLFACVPYWNVFLCWFSLLSWHSTGHQSEKRPGHSSLSCLGELLPFLTVNPSPECAWPLSWSAPLSTSLNEPPFLALSCKAIFSICWVKSMTQAVWYGFRDLSKPAMHNSLFIPQVSGACRDKKPFC